MCRVEKSTELKVSLFDALRPPLTAKNLNELEQITSVARDFDFFFQEKWRLAIDRPGSGNNKNIGSTTTIDELTNGDGLFAREPNGEAVFNDYWMYYMTKDMARAHDLARPPYKNLSEYYEWKRLPGGQP